MLKPVPLDEAGAWLAGHAAALRAEEVASGDAAGRVLAAPVKAAADHPRVPTAAVDGFALDAEASTGASDYNPLPFSVSHGDEGTAAPNRAWPVVSGQAVPGGADAVLPIEEAALRGRVLDVHAPVASGDHVIPAGRETRGGADLMPAGRVLRPADIALLLELGVSRVPVVRRPRAGIIVVRRDVPDGGGPMVRALVTRDGGIGAEPMYPGDEGLAGALAGCTDDLVLVIGGSGPGTNDRAAGALEEAGELAFRGVAISPGETTTVGRMGSAPVIVLPGPSLAALFAYDMVAGPALRRFAGRGPVLPYGTRSAVLDRKIASGLGRLECCRVRVSGDRAEPLAVSDNRTLSTAVHADGFVLVPEQSEGFAAGAEVTVHLYDQRY